MRRVLFLLAILLAGCGGGSAGPVAHSDQEGAATTTVVGRLYLGGDVAGATFRLEDSAGRVLATGVTNANGMVFLDGLRPPGDLRAVATVPGYAEEFRADLPAFQPRHRQARITLLTDLASRYRQRHGTTLAEAETRVKAATRVAHSIDVGIGLVEPNPVFSDVALLRAAGEQGGWTSWRQAVLAQAASGAGRSYLLSLDQLDRPITGLEPGLAAVAEASRIRLQRRLGIPDATPQRLALRYPPLTLAEGPTSLGGQFLLGVSTGLTGNLLTDVVGGVFGWAANQLGLNYGTAGQLQEIEDQLATITTLLEGLITDITDTELESQVQAANDLLAPVQTANTALQTNLQSANITNQPFSPPPSFSTLVGDIDAPDYPTILTEVNNALHGTGKILSRGAGVVVNQRLGLDQPSNMQGFPWRANAVLDRVMPLYRYFAGQQTLALNLYAEEAHNYLLNPNPVLGVANLLPNYEAAVANLKLQRQQLPFYGSSWGTLVDMQNGIMWWEDWHNADTFDHAKSAADSYTLQVVLIDGSVTTYDDWRLPTFGECLALQDRGKYCPTKDSSVPVNSHDSYPDTGQSTAGLPALGFQNVATALKSAPNDNGSNGDMWMFYYIEEDGKLTLNGSWEFRLNHGSTNVSYENRSSDTNAYVLCRGFGPATLVTAVDGGYYPPVGTLGRNLLPGEIAQYGVPTSLALNLAPAQPVTYPDPQDPSQTTTFTPPAGSSQARALVNWQVHLGGSFTMGYGSTKSFSNSSYTASASVWTYDPGTGHPNMTREMISWTSSNPSLMRVMNAPYVSGIVLPLASPGTANVLATLMSAPVASTPDNFTPPAKTLESLQISPRNQIYGVTPAQPASGSFPYYCTGFYSDGTMETLAPDVQWTIPANAANAQIVANASGVALEMNQPGQATPVPYNVTISVAYGGKTDSTTIQIVPPVAP